MNALSPRRRTVDVAARLAAFLVAGCLAYRAWLYFRLGHKVFSGPPSIKQDLEFVFHAVLAVVAGISAYVGVKGPLYGAEAAENRGVGLIRLGLGCAAIAAGVGLSYLGTWILGRVSSFFIVFHGLFLLGVIGVIIGLAAVITGRDLADDHELAKDRAGSRRPGR